MRFIHYPFSTLKYQLTRKASVNPKVFYQTVAETNKYSSFLPWCSQSVILKSGENYDETRLNIKFGLYNVSYLSNVTFEQIAEGVKTIRSVCKENPFKVIDSLWKIEYINQNMTQVNYKIEFEFLNPIYQQAAGLFLRQLGEGMYNNFLTQALKTQRIIRSKNNLQEVYKNYPDIKEKIEKNKLEDEAKMISTKYQFDDDYHQLVVKNLSSLFKE